MKYTVIIEHEGEIARLECSSLKEAQEVRRSFINYGEYQSGGIRIEASDNPATTTTTNGESKNEAKL